jgi:nucleoside-diphosphate-sugar epimerase
MNVIIIGGTGFIGYHAALVFLQRGHTVSILALPPLPAQELFPPEVKIRLADLNTLQDHTLLELLRGQDALVFAAGADDRTIPKAPAYEFFHEANVRTPQRLFRLARQAGVRRGVILGSYFAHFDRIWPEMELAKHHPYIRSRAAQIEATLEASLPKLELVVLELPYIFGAMPGRTPLWAPLIRYLRSPIPLFYPRGGSNCISVKHVAEAIVGAVERAQGGDIFQVGDENLTWEDLLTRLGLAAGVHKRVITIPDWIVGLGMRGVDLYYHLQGKEGGLDLVSFTWMQTAEAFFDPMPSRQALCYGQGGLDQAFEETVAAC